MMSKHSINKKGRSGCTTNKEHNMKNNSNMYNADSNPFMNNHGIYIPNETTCIEFYSLGDDSSWFATEADDDDNDVKMGGANLIITNVMTSAAEFQPTSTIDPNDVVELNVQSNNVSLNAGAVPFQPSFLLAPPEKVSSPLSSLTDVNKGAENNISSDSAIMVNWLVPRKLMQLSVQKIREQLRLASIQECVGSTEVTRRTANSGYIDEISSSSGSYPWIMLIKFPEDLVDEIKSHCFFNKYRLWPRESLTMTNRDLLFFFNDPAYQYHRSPISSLMLNLFSNGFIQCRSERYREINDQYQLSEPLWTVPDILFADSMLFANQIANQSFFEASFSESNLTQYSHIFFPIYDSFNKTWPRAALFRLPWAGCSGWVSIYHFISMPEENIREIDRAICRRIISWFHRESTAGLYLPSLDVSFREQSILNALHVKDVLNHWQWVDGRGIIFLSEFLSRPRIKTYKHEINYLLDDKDAFKNRIDTSYINPEVMQRNPTELFLKWIAITIAVYTQYYGRNLGSSET